MTDTGPDLTKPLYEVEAKVGWISFGWISAAEATKLFLKFMPPSTMYLLIHHGLVDSPSPSWSTLVAIQDKQRH